MNERLLTARELAELLGFAPATVLDVWEHGELSGGQCSRPLVEVGA